MIKYVCISSHASLLMLIALVVLHKSFAWQSCSSRQDNEGVLSEDPYTATLASLLTDALAIVPARHARNCQSFNHDFGILKKLLKTPKASDRRNAQSETTKSQTKKLHSAKAPNEKRHSNNNGTVLPRQVDGLPAPGTVKIDRKEQYQLGIRNIADDLRNSMQILGAIDGPGQLEAVLSMALIRNGFIIPPIPNDLATPTPRQDRSSRSRIDSPAPLCNGQDS